MRKWGPICRSCGKRKIEWGGLIACPVEIQVLIIIRQTTASADNAKRKSTMSRDDGVTIKKTAHGVRGGGGSVPRTGYLPGYNRPISVGISVAELERRVAAGKRQSSQERTPRPEQGN